MIYIPLPDLEARQYIFKVHLGDTPHYLTESDFEHLARKTEGFSGSDIDVCGSDKSILDTVKDVLFDPVRKNQHAKFFGKNSDCMWVVCEPTEHGAVEITLQELDEQGLAAKVLPVITRLDFDKVASRQEPTMSKAELMVHERFTEEFRVEG